MLWRTSFDGGKRHVTFWAENRIAAAAWLAEAEVAWKVLFGDLEELGVSRFNTGANMAKIVYNACFGGFSLSAAAAIRYGELKGFKVWADEEGLFQSFWRKPPEERKWKEAHMKWHEMSAEEKAAYNKLYREENFDTRNISRTDSTLVQVVEELGEAANGRCASLRIAEVPSGVKYRIDEYDGSESVMTPDDYEWEIAP